MVRVLGGKVAGLGQTRQGLGGHKGAGAGQASSFRGPGPVQGGRAPGHQATLSLTTVRDTYNDNTLKKLTNPYSNFDKYF